MTTARTATRPDDKPFDFDLNAVQAESDLTPFVFRWASKDQPNRRLSMAHLESLDVWPLMEGAESGDMGAMAAIFETALGDQWADFRATPLPQFKLKALFDAYRKFCGQQPGESPASSDS